MAHLYEKAVSCEMCFPTPLLKENPHLWCVASRMRMYVDVCGRMRTNADVLYAAGASAAGGSPRRGKVLLSLLALLAQKYKFWPDFFFLV
jgi:hypothetical protein